MPCRQRMGLVRSGLRSTILADQVGVVLSVAASRRRNRPSADTGDSRGAECHVGLIPTKQRHVRVLVLVQVGVQVGVQVPFTIFSIATYAQQTRARGHF